jgi:phosphoadenosine phosphosulfate reductase
MMAEFSKALQARVQNSVSQLSAALNEFKNVCYANSLGPESMVLTDLIWGPAQGSPAAASSAAALSAIEIFSIDTGRLYPETYDLIERVQQRYGRALRIYYPDASELESWVGANGINGFREGIVRRHGCCAIRKVEPFRRAVSGRSAWVTGIRRAQSAGRAMAAPVTWDGEYGLHKVSPLLDWTEKEVWEYIRKRGLPYNTLHDKGFPSIGCAPCTRAVQPGDDQRSGRWWWERSESRECGLHPRPQVGFSK